MRLDSFWDDIGHLPAVLRLTLPRRRTTASPVPLQLPNGDQFDDSRSAIADVSQLADLLSKGVVGFLDLLFGVGHGLFCVGLRNRIGAFEVSKSGDRLAQSNIGLLEIVDCLAHGFAMILERQRL